MLLGLGTLCYLLLEIILSKRTGLQRLSVSPGVLTFQNILPSAFWNASEPGRTLEVPLKSETDVGKLSSLQNTSLMNTSLARSLGRPKNDSNVVLTTLKPGETSSGEGVRPEKCRKCFLTDFPELITNDAVCKTESNDTLDLVMLVLTTHSAVERRQAIRQTWASFTQNNTATKLRHVFLLGRSRDARHMRSVQEEQLSMATSSCMTTSTATGT
ncbi:hypothetical protein C0Q70_16443 [Pomacea canaliculata]|uniref:Hexosyltransferase n=1 Tax=Pomacea canaliculata TaxID=400727 RepID=A0A2T7NPT2_POMCA|nr:hypothetical protein C0Q70_16443 [Pomacea canaliculata]